MRRTDVNDVGVAPDAIIKALEVGHSGRLTLVEFILQLFHGYSVVLGVVEGKVANLQKSKADLRIDII